MSDVDSMIFTPDDPLKLPCGIFKRVQVVTQPLGGSMIAWELWEGFGAVGPFEFYVDVAQAGSQEWETLNKTAIVNECIYIDLCQRTFDAQDGFYYRVRLNLPNVKDPVTGLCKHYQSQPQQANGLWSKRDWLTAREIARKEYLLQRKRTNLTAVGHILKRMRYGAKCPDCTEYDTGEVQNGKCPVCFGTGFIGGYFPAIKMTLTGNAPWTRQFKRDGQVSMRDDIVRESRCVSYPFPDSADVWVRKDNGERYYVSTVTTQAEVGGIPVVISLGIRLAPVTDIIYTVPLHVFKSSSSSPSGSSSSSSGGNPACNWRVGKDDEPEW